jgi:catechol 2,3-dioxygenase-like lactoylglutathione lyase family enzyme
MKETTMISGVHVLLYSTDPEADRAFLRDVLGFHSVDAGGGWPIFALPPAELAVHPGDGGFVQSHGGSDMMGAVVYLMCDDVERMVETLAAQGITCTPVQTAEWGLATSLTLPSGTALGLYQPTHPTALDRR